MIPSGEEDMPHRETEERPVNLKMGVKNRNKSYAILLLGLALLVAFPAHAGWLIYHKPAFEGKIVDSETGQPIEGVVVELIYRKASLPFVPLGDYTPFKVKQTMTNVEGKFRFPAYTTIISPFATTSATVRFTIFKSGYASLWNKDMEDIFTYPPYASGTIEGPWEGKSNVRIKFSPGVVFLPKLIREEDIGYSSTIISSEYKPLKESLIMKALYKAWGYTK